MHVMEISFKIDDRRSFVTISCDDMFEFDSLLSFYKNDDRINLFSVRNMSSPYLEYVYERKPKGKWSEGKWTRSLR